MELSPRKDKILASVVRDYVKSGEPVGSKAIADEIGVSSATVRNEMAELIDLGLLEQPHTSAGRVPSQRGYREYVNRLMEVPALGEEEKRYFDSVLHNSGYEPERVFAAVCRALAAAGRCAAIATMPSGAAASVKAVQFVQTSRRTAMLLMMSSAGTMKNRVFRCDFDLTHEMMRVFFRSFNEKVAGVPVADITPAFLQTMAASLGDLYALAISPLRALLAVAQDTMETQVYTAGEMNLLFCPGLEPRPLLDFLEQERELSALLRQKPGKVTVLIGRETGRPELKNASLLVSRYRVSAQDAGALAVLGPTRMDYARLTAILSYLTARVSDMLNVVMREE